MSANAGYEDGTDQYELTHGEFVAVRKGKPGLKWHAAAVPARSATLCGLTIGPYAYPAIRFVPNAELCSKCRRAMEAAP